MVRVLIISMATLVWQAAGMTLAARPCDSAPKQVKSCCCGDSGDCKCCCRKGSSDETPSESDDGPRICPCNKQAAPAVKETRIVNERPRDCFPVPVASHDAPGADCSLSGMFVPIAHGPPAQLSHLSTLILLI